MPYNPNSAYPRKTTYIPPTYGDHSFKRAVNEVDRSSQNTFGGGPYRPRGGEIYNPVVARAAQSAIHPGAAAGLEAAARHPIANRLAPIGQGAVITAAQATGNVVGPMVAGGAANVAGKVAARAATRAAGGAVGRVGTVANRYVRPGHISASNLSTVLGPLTQGSAQQAVGTVLSSQAPRFTMNTGNPAAIQTRNAASELADDMAFPVLNGTMPGFTGQANINPKKKRK